MKCSIVIRAHNEEQHIGRLLAGITQQQGFAPGEVETILVDSGSTDATLSIASRYPVQIVHIRPEEFTFGRSLNLGIAQAQGEFVALISAHCYPVYPDWLEQLLRPFADERIALSYGKQRGGETTKFSEHQIFARWFPEQSDFNQAHPFCNNANAAIRRTLWQQHPYDETLTGLEDLAWSDWAMKQGGRIAYVAEAEIIHLHDETPPKVFNRYRREAIAFKQIFPAEKFLLRDFLRLFSANVFSDAWHAWRSGRLASVVGEIIWFRFNQFWGAYQGNRYHGPLTWQLRQTFYYPPSMLAAPNAARRDVQPIHYGEVEKEP